MARLERLQNRMLDRLSASIAVPKYARESMKAGIVHFGPGAFHRGHQAVMTDDALGAAGGDWGICGVSLQSPGVRDALRPQDCLYTLAVTDEEASYRIIGAVSEILVAPESPAAVIERLCDPATRVVTATVTEKGYCLTPQGDLDANRPEIRDDLSRPNSPKSLAGFLSRALIRRRAAGIAPFTVVSCDNLSDNGPLLKRAVTQFAGQLDPDLAKWIEGEVAFPQTMVDSITPATDDEARARVSRAIGAEDAWPIQREYFAQWVIEDSFSNERPLWEAGGATFTNEVAGYERAKLRMLNGAHSAFAHLGLLVGHQTVLEAVSDPALHGLVEDMLREEVEPLLRPPSGLDLAAYRRAVLRRFANPRIAYRLAQIAGDGSQKIQMRLLPSLREAIALGAPSDRLALAVAAWLLLVKNAAREGRRLNDPLEAELIAVGKQLTSDAAEDVEKFLALNKIFGGGSADRTFREVLTLAYQRLGDGSPSVVRQALAALR